jgi:hypothetical protein
MERFFLSSKSKKETFQLSAELYGAFLLIKFKVPVFEFVQFISCKILSRKLEFGGLFT